MSSKICVLWLRKLDKKEIYYLRFREPETGKIKRISLGHDDPDLAEKQRFAKELELRGNIRELTDLNLARLVAVYLANNNRRLEPSTCRLIEYSFEVLIEAVGNIPAKIFGFAEAEKYQNFLIDSGRSQVTANMYCKHCRAVFSWAVDSELLEVNPFKKLKMFRICKKPVRILDTAEWLSLYRACNDLTWRARLLAAKTAGLRFSEILNLTENDIDFGNWIIHVQPKREALKTWRWVVKDKDRREVPLVKALADLLQRIREILPAGQPYLFLHESCYKRKIELMRAGALDDRLRGRPDESMRYWRELHKQSGIRHFTFHDLRRTCITEWLESGLEPHEVMFLAGHSDVQTTVKYYVGKRQTLISKARQASEALI